MLSKLRPTTVLRRLLTSTAPGQRALHAVPSARSNLLIRSTMKQTQHMRLFTTDNEKTTFDITDATKETESISSDVLSQAQIEKLVTNFEGLAMKSKEGRENECVISTIELGIGRWS
jgi:hypothetical protein